MSERDIVLRTESLAVHYGEHTALRGVDLAFERGRITALVGPSGCGKTSFLQSLNRLIDLIPRCRIEGRVLFDGQDIYRNGIDLPALRLRIGQIFQKPNPFPTSIAKNVQIALREHGIRDATSLRARTERVLRDVGLWDEVSTRLDSAATGLSGGQQQRLCIARALALEPEVLLLDEPCSSLDPLASGVVEDLIVNLRGRYTVIVVTHNLEQARRIADDLAVFWMQDGAGCLIEHGPAEQIFEQPRSELTKAYVNGLRG